jgi:predicted patatin/cPLA2 family phospholipase
MGLMNEIGLVLEGGGMRGVYTGGVLDCMKNIGS